MSNLAQTRAIHGLRRTLAIADDDYRDLLEARTGKRSSTQLSEVEADGVIAELKALARQPLRRPNATMAGPYASKLRALWLSAWNLGIVRERDDRALLAFVERQTGIAHTRFLTGADDAAKAIEALKGWIAREAGVRWPDQADARRQKRDIAWLAKLIVIMAIAERLGVDAEIEGRMLGLPPQLASYGSTHLDKLAEQLGTRLRGRSAKAA